MVRASLYCTWFTLVACIASCNKTAQAPEETKPAAQPLAAIPGAAATPTAAGGVGKVDSLEGQPKLSRGGTPVPVKAGVLLQAGDQVATGTGGKLRIVLNDESVLAVGPDSQLVLTQMDVTRGRNGQIKVLAGKFWMKVAKWATADSRVEVATPSAVAGVRGTTLWGDTQVDAICSLDGEVEVKNLVEPHTAATLLSAGHCAAELSKGKVSPLTPSADQVQGYLKQVLIQ